MAKHSACNSKGGLRELGLDRTCTHDVQTHLSTACVVCWFLSRISTLASSTSYVLMLELPWQRPRCACVLRNA
eukprot:2909263-Amphidinium_carterae.1